MKTLLQRARSGDDEAFAALFQQHAQGLWKTALSVMHDEDQAADMMQETAVKAWRSLPSFDGASALPTWLTRILLNACFDELRRQKRLVPFADVEEAPGQDAYATASGAPAGGIDETTRLDVRAALDRLGDSDRLVLTLFYMNDLGCADIARALDISEGAVRTRLTRARARFKELYAAPEAGQPEPDERRAKTARARKYDLNALAEVAI